MASEASASKPLPIWRYIVGVAGVLVGVVFVNSVPPRYDPRGNLLIMVFALSVIWGCLLMMSARGANAVARHGLVGLVSGFSIGVFDTKAGLVLGLIGAFVGAILGNVVGAVRLAAAGAMSQTAEPATRGDRILNKGVANTGQPQSSPSANQPAADGPA